MELEKRLFQRLKGNKFLLPNLQVQSLEVLDTILSVKTLEKERLARSNWVHIS